MTTDAQRAANRRNAARSTGPRTAGGKATAAQNARRHGAAGTPAPGPVAAWFRIIVGDPDARPPDLMAPEREPVLALALAEAEARLVAARTALEAHLEDPLAAGRDSEIEGFYKTEMAALQAEARDAGGWTQERRRQSEQLRRIIIRYEAQRQKTAGSRERLLSRYLREAQGHRNRAFATWIAYLAGRQGAGGPEQLQTGTALSRQSSPSHPTRDLPKRTQLQP